MNHRFAPLRLIPNVPHEFGAIGLGHVFVQKFGGSLNGGEGRLEFVGQSLNVAFGILASFEGFPHIMEGIGESVHFTTKSNLWFGAAFAARDGPGIGGEFADRTKKPHEDCDNECKNAKADEGDRPDDGFAAILHERQDIFLGLVNAEAAHDFSILVHRGSNEHDG